MDYRRVRLDGGCYFFTLTTEQRRPLLTHHIGLLRTAMREVQQRMPFVIDGIVIMPDHLHCIWRLPEGDHDYSNRWAQIKRRFSSELPAQEVRQSLLRRREKGIWQRRFWEHLIRDEQDWRNHMDYLHYNPVKHGYCQQVADWPYSSFRRCVERGWYPPDWGQNAPERIQGWVLE